MAKLCALWSLWRRDEQWTILICLMCLSLCSGIGFTRWRTSPSLPPLFTDVSAAKGQVAVASRLGQPDTSQAPAAAQKTIVIHVVGAVKRPGVLALPASSRVLQAIESAGGAISTGDVQALNLAARLKDGQQVRVPVVGESRSLNSGGYAVGQAGAALAGSTGHARPVNINSASVAEIEALPGIGPAIAGRIVAHRRKLGSFRQLGDLDAVPGLGAKKLEQLRPLITF